MHARTYMDTHNTRMDPLTHIHIHTHGSPSAPSPTQPAAKLDAYYSDLTVGTSLLDNALSSIKRLLKRWTCL